VRGKEVIEKNGIEREYMQKNGGNVRGWGGTWDGGTWLGKRQNI
jgi:hypothetical protein